MIPQVQLYKGDCLDITKSIPSQSIDLILCDPPYGQTAKNKWDEIIPFPPLWAEYERIIRRNGAIILFANGMFTAKLMTSNEKMWRYNLIWEKTQPTGFLNANRMPLRSHEDICIFYKSLPVYHPQKTFGHERKVALAHHKRNCKSTTDYGEYELASYDSTERYPKSILTFPKDIQKSALHPTQKPVALLEWLIRSYSDEGMTVLDNCMGSGSTGVAAIHTKRNFIGIEQEDDYFSIAEKRLKKELELLSD